MKLISTDDKDITFKSQSHFTKIMLELRFLGETANKNAQRRLKVYFRMYDMETHTHTLRLVPVSNGLPPPSHL